MNILFEHTRLRRAVMLMALVLLALAASVSLVFAAAEADSGPLRLRANIESQDEVLRFGDVFANAGPLANVALTRAPEPGRKVSLDPQWLAARARAYGRVWQNLSGLKRVTVSRAGRRIGAGQLRALIGAELARRGDGAAYEIALANRMQSLYAPLDATGGPQLLSIDFQRQSGVFTARIAPYADARPVLVSGRAWALVQVPALLEAHRAGDVIAPQDITWIKVRQARLRPDTVLEAKAVEGMAARRGIRAGQPLRITDFKRPAAVTKGQIITIVYQAPGLRLTARGRATGEAALGEPLRAVNLQSHRTIDVVVTGPGMATASAGYDATIAAKGTSS